MRNNSKSFDLVSEPLAYFWGLFRSILGASRLCSGQMVFLGASAGFLFIAVIDASPAGRRYFCWSVVLPSSFWLLLIVFLPRSFRLLLNGVSAEFMPAIYCWSVFFIPAIAADRSFSWWSAICFCLLDHWLFFLLIIYSPISLCPLYLSSSLLRCYDVSLFWMLLQQKTLLFFQPVTCRTSEQHIGWIWKELFEAVTTCRHILEG